MNNYYDIKNNVIEPILRKNGFKKFSNVWIRRLQDGTSHIVVIHNRTVVVNDFNLGISYGLYYDGVMELLYNMPFVAKHGVANCIILASKWKTGINDSWDKQLFKSIRHEA